MSCVCKSAGFRSRVFSGEGSNVEGYEKRDTSASAKFDYERVGVGGVCVGLWIQ